MVICIFRTYLGLEYLPSKEPPVVNHCMAKVFLTRGTPLTCVTVGRPLPLITTRQSGKCDVMMDKSRYFYEFVKLTVIGNKGDIFNFFNDYANISIFTIFKFSKRFVGSFIFGHPANNLSQFDCIIPSMLRWTGLRAIMDFNGNLLTRCGKTYRRTFLSWIAGIYCITDAHNVAC